MKMCVLNKVLQCSGIKKNYIKILQMLNGEAESNSFSKGFFFGGFRNNRMTTSFSFLYRTTSLGEVTSKQIAAAPQFLHFFLSLPYCLPESCHNLFYCWPRFAGNCFSHLLTIFLDSWFGTAWSVKGRCSSQRVRSPTAPLPKFCTSVDTGLAARPRNPVQY